jgi:DNA-binding transcriptional LysR family regulator
MSVPLYKQLNGKIDLKQLRHAVAAADYGSFRQAAEALNIKQSTLSRSILQLEHATSIRLFERSPGGVAVSHSGSDFIRMAKAVLEQINEFDLLKAMPSRSEVLRIGFCTSLSAGDYGPIFWNSIADFLNSDSSCWKDAGLGSR